MFYHASSDFNEYLSQMIGTQATKRNVRAVSIEVDTERFSKEEPMALGNKEWCQT